MEDCRVGVSEKFHQKNVFNRKAYENGGNCGVPCQNAEIKNKISI